MWLLEPQMNGGVVDFHAGAVAIARWGVPLRTFAPGVGLGRSAAEAQA